MINILFNYIFGLTFQSPFSKVHFHFENGIWKVSPNIELKIVFIILLFSKNIFAYANIIFNLYM